MNQDYTKPIIIANNDLSEGVYLDSGCYTASASIRQTPQGGGEGTYRIQVNGIHKATHTKEAQTLYISFNQNVTYESGGSGLISGNGTPMLVIQLSYHQNSTDNIGFGDLVVTSEAGLAITSVSITD